MFLSTTHIWANVCWLEIMDGVGHIIIKCLSQLFFCKVISFEVTWVALLSFMVLIDFFVWFLKHSRISEYVISFFLDCNLSFDCFLALLKVNILKLDYVVVVVWPKGHLFERRGAFIIIFTDGVEGLARLFIFLLIAYFENVFRVNYWCKLIAGFLYCEEMIKLFIQTGVLDVKLKLDVTLLGTLKLTLSSWGAQWTALGV